MRRNDTISRPDRVLLAALAIILATASAALGSGMTHGTNSPDSAANSAAQALNNPSPTPVAAVAVAQDTVANQLVADHRCLAEALYYEARGEGRSGEQAIAEVVFHRMDAGHYGHSICAVVYEGSSHRGCQFSFACSGELLRPREAAAWKESEELALQILTGEVRLGNATGGATNYHAVSANPFWAPMLQKTAQIGNHIFYRAELGRGRILRSASL